MPKNKGELFDLKNIEQAQKLIEQINKLVSAGAAFTSNGKNIAQYAENISKVKDLYAQLNKLSNTHFEKLDTMNKDYFKQVQEQIKLAEKSIQLQNEQIENEAIHNKLVNEKTKHLEYLAQVDKDMEKFDKNLNSVVNSSYERAKKDLDKEYEKLNNVQKMFTNKQAFIDSKLGTKEDYTKKAKAYLDTQNTFNIENKEGVLSKTDMSNLLKEYMGENSNFYEGSNNLNLGSQVLNVASDTLKTAANKLLNLATQGITNQSNAYEDTFTNISVRNRTTRSDYYDAQWELNNVLTEEGLNNNIRSSDVQQMWNTLANQGIQVDLTNEQTTTNAIETILTKQIVPYLDTSTAYFQQLAYNNPELMKQIRGIDIATKDVAGSSTFITEHLEEMVNQLSPISSLAESEIGVQYAKVSGEYQNLIDQGLTDYEIGQMYNNAVEVYKNPYGTLSNGSLDQKLAVVDVVTNPNKDLTNFGDVVSSTNQATNTVSGFFGGLQGDTQALVTSGASGAWGISGVDYATTLNLAKNNYDMEEAERAGNETAANINTAAEQATQDYTNDKNQTNKELQNITLENLMNELSVINEWMGNWTDVIVTAIKGVGTLLTTWLGGKFLNLLTGGKLGTWLGGMFTSGKATQAATTAIKTGTLSSSGGLLLGGLTTVAGTALAVAISKGMMDKDQENAQAVGEKQLEGTSMEGNTAAGIASRTKNLDDLNTWTDIGSVTGNLGQFANNVINTFSSDIAGDNKRRYANLVSALQQEGISDNEKREYTAAFMLLLASKGRLSDIDVTEEDLKKYLEDESGPSTTRAISKIGKSPLWVYQPHDDNGKIKQLDEGWMQNTLFTWNYHRQGLDYVPEDDYPALLHQGEAVLTASTANELRNLTDTYRETATQSYNIDAIVQNQTSALITKMDEIIRAITTGTSTPETQNTASSKLYNAMLNIQSTKGF